MFITGTFEHCEVHREKDNLMKRERGWVNPVVRRREKKLTNFPIMTSKATNEPNRMALSGLTGLYIKASRYVYI